MFFIHWKWKLWNCCVTYINLLLIFLNFWCTNFWVLITWVWTYMMFQYLKWYVTSLEDGHTLVQNYHFNLQPFCNSTQMLDLSFFVPFLCNLNYISLYLERHENHLQVPCPVQGKSCFLIPSVLDRLVNLQIAYSYVDCPCFQTTFPFVVTMIK